MAQSTLSTDFIEKLFKDFLERPDFSFLDRWDSSADDRYFFPRLNHNPHAKGKLTRDHRKLVKQTIREIEELDDLVQATLAELGGLKSSISDHIEVFHRDGQAAMIAVPVIPALARNLASYALASELKHYANSEAMLKDIQWLKTLTADGSKAGTLRGRFSKKEARRRQERFAWQLILAATGHEERNVHSLAKKLNRLVAVSKGEIPTRLEDWWGAIARLDSLKDFPENLTVETIDQSTVERLREPMMRIQAAYERQEFNLASAKAVYSSWQEKQTHAILANETLDSFAKRVRGQRFPLKVLKDRLADEGMGTSVDDALRFLNSGVYLTAQLSSARSLLLNFQRDCQTRVATPRPTTAPELFHLLYQWEHFKAQNILGAHSTFRLWASLLRENPTAVHLAARDSESLSHLIKTLHSYSDSERQARLLAYREPTQEEALEYYRSNPAAYQAILGQLGLHALSLEQISGFLAPELTKTIRALELDTSLLNATLRSYQLFAAQYALHQKRIILGDEMGLGKTLSALAVVTHLAANGHERALVVCPLAVLENWKRETLKHSSLKPKMLYGETLQDELEEWANGGGLALTTYEAMSKVNASLANWSGDPLKLDAIVVDECHKIKNPEAQRTRALMPWLQASTHAMLMSGTPMENDLEEFITLISYVQPYLSLPEDRSSYSKFRKAIAPVYLRRNQEDVLTELEPLQETIMAVELTAADEDYYRRALANNDWQLARRAATLSGANSSKVQAVQSIVKESMANGKKVLVFSYYHDTLEVLQRVLTEDDPYEPLTGKLSSLQRQEVVDRFSRADEPGVLLAQIKAGGEGLNIQAASVVIIVEPQVKPSLEDQAVARAHRMGQVNPVQVYRLRGARTIDERWAKMVDEKRALFAATAGKSDAAQWEASLGSSESLFLEEKKAWGLA